MDTSSPAPDRRVWLHPEWRAILRYSWSLRLAILAAALSAAEVVCSVFSGAPPIKPVYFAALSGVVTFAAAIARVLVQTRLGSADR